MLDVRIFELVILLFKITNEILSMCRIFFELSIKHDTKIVKDSLIEVYNPIDNLFNHIVIFIA